MLSLKNKILAMATVGILAMGGAMTTAHAQEGYSPHDPMGQQQQVNVTDTELQKFANAQVAVSQLQAQFMGQAQGMESQDELQALQQQADEQMIEVIEDANLSVQEYNQIANLVQTNEQVQQRYLQLVQ